MQASLHIIPIILYLCCGWLLLIKLTRPALIQSVTRQHILPLAAIAILLHGGALYLNLFTDAGLNIHFYNVLSLVAWLVALLLSLTAITMRIECLGAIVYPFAALGLALALAPAEPQLLAYHMKSGMLAHILLSILAYSLLSIAAVQALLLYIQDLHLHNKHPGGFIRALPPLETMEVLMFRIIGLGFIVLSIALLTGMFYLQDMFAQHIVHKTILSLIAWLLFAVLLWGRWQFGWRGRIAIRWTYSGFILLMLAYFGSKFVIEQVLNR